MTKPYYTCDFITFVTNLYYTCDFITFVTVYYTCAFNRGPSKIDRPTSHPSNPIHNAETSNPIHPNPIHKDQKTFQPPQVKSEGNHEILKAGVFIGAAISAFAVYKLF